MQREVYTKYDNECVVYLALQILKCLHLENTWLLIDLYYEEVTKIYEDYIFEDNSNVSLLESINQYIDNHEQEIRNRIKKCFE